MTTIFARQGDLVIQRVEHKDMSDFTEAQDIALAGSDSSSHTLKGSALHRRDGSTTHLRLTSPLVLEHADRHLNVAMVPGDYTVSPLRERGGEGDREVND